MELWRDKHTLEEIQAAAMLLGEPRPVLCSCCGGLQKSRAIFGYRTCPQCDGTGFDYIGRETARYAGLEQSTAHRTLDDRVEQTKWAVVPENLIESMLLSWHQQQYETKVDRRMVRFDYLVIVTAVVSVICGVLYG